MRKTSPIHSGVRSPMVGNVGKKIGRVSIGASTVIPNSAPMPAPMSSPLEPANPGKRPNKLS